MGKRYITIGAFFIILVACFFIFFDNPSNKELYYECVDKLSRVNSYDNIEDNRELNIDVDNSYFNNQYNYVVTFTSNTVLNNFKAFALYNIHQNIILVKNSF